MAYVICADLTLYMLSEYSGFHKAYQMSWKEAVNAKKYSFIKIALIHTKKIALSFSMINNRCLKISVMQKILSFYISVCFKKNLYALNKIKSTSFMF